MGTVILWNYTMVSGSTQGRVKLLLRNHHYVFGPFTVGITSIDNYWLRHPYEESKGCASHYENVLIVKTAHKIWDIALDVQFKSLHFQFHK